MSAEDLNNFTKVSAPPEEAAPVLLPAFDMGLPDHSALESMQMNQDLAGIPNNQLPPIFAQGPQESESSGVVLKLALMLLLGLVVFMGYFAYDEVQNNRDPVQGLLKFVGLGGKGEEVSLEEEAARAQALARERAAREKKAAEVQVAPANPYWELPNHLANLAKKPLRYLSPEEELIWRNGLKSRFAYQHFATVASARESKIGGSEKILWEALLDKKFWTRMNAAFGLVEMGIRIDVDTVDRAIGDARSSLMANYMKRFLAKSTESERYVLRHAIKLVDARSRLAILEVLNRVPDDSRGIYMVAATYDPGKGIQNFANRALGARPISNEKFETITSFIMGKEKQSALLAFFEPTEKAKPAEKTEESKTAGAKPSGASTVEYYEVVKTVDVSEDGVVDDGFKQMSVIEIKPEK